LRQDKASTTAAGSGDCSSCSGQRQLVPELLQVRGHDRWIDRLLCCCWLGELDQRERNCSGRQKGEHGTEHDEPGSQFAKYFLVPRNEIWGGVAWRISGPLRPTSQAQIPNFSEMEEGRSLTDF